MLDVERTSTLEIVWDDYCGTINYRASAGAGDVNTIRRRSERRGRDKILRCAMASLEGKKRKHSQAEAPTVAILPVDDEAKKRKLQAAAIVAAASAPRT